MIQAVDCALSELLSDNADFDGLGSPRVLFEPPSTAPNPQDSQPLINLYLYDVRECLERRDTSFRRVKGTGDNTGKVRRERALIYYDLSYLVTVRAKTPSLEHDIFYSVIKTLLHNPELTLKEEPGAEPVPLVVSHPDELEGPSLGDIWQAFGGPVRPSLRVVVTVPIEPPQKRPFIPPVEDIEVDVDEMGVERVAEAMRRDAQERAEALQREVMKQAKV